MRSSGRSRNVPQRVGELGYKTFMLRRAKDTRVAEHAPFDSITYGRPDHSGAVGGANQEGGRMVIPVERVVAEEYLLETGGQVTQTEVIRSICSPPGP